MGINGSSLMTNAMTDVEKDLLYSRHHISRELFRGNFSSPVQDVLNTGWRARVLHVNTTLGTWLAEMSADFPGCTYIGVNPTIPSPLHENGRPFDVEFVEAKIHDGLPYNDNTFDFIFMRFCAWDFTENEWEKVVIRELVRCLKPGGWIEFMDFDMNFQNQGPTSIKMLNCIYDLQHMKNRIRRLTDIWEEFLMTTNQIQHVRNRSEYLPIGRHGGKLGDAASQFFHDFIIYHLPRYARNMGIRTRDIPNIANTYCEEANTCRTMAPLVRVFGQKKS